MAPSGWHEDDLIARLLMPLAGEGAHGLRDDAASLNVGSGLELVLTCDTLVAGVHFFPDDPAASIARKALAVNVSDLAAKAARPRGYLLSLALPGNTDAVWLEAFVAGLKAAAESYRCPLLGGDTTSTPGPLCITVSAFGEVPQGRMVPRTGVRAGDVLAVSGVIGDAALGLILQQEPGRAGWAALTDHDRRYLIDRYRHPAPRLDMTDILQRYANAAMDVSDGLVGDLTKMLRASGTGGTLELDAIPVSASARRAIGAETALQECVFTGGDDYEILFSVSPGVWDDAVDAASRSGVAVTRIGYASSATGLRCIDRDGTAVVYAKGSYVHRGS